MKLLDGVRASAYISECGTYRYTLSRIWDENRPIVLWVMLNPSTASAVEDDRTLRKIQEFSRTWGYGGLIVANLFALRSKDPKDLRRHPDPVGPENDLMLESLARDNWIDKVTVGWGVHGSLNDRDQVVAEIFRKQARRLWCLAATKDGHPWHPLYLKPTTIRSIWAPPKRRHHGFHQRT